MNKIKSKSEIVRVFVLMILPIVISLISCQRNIEDKLDNYPTISDPDVTYYLDAENGNDTNDGQSETTAWKSLERINMIWLQSGNKILLRRGSVFKGQVAPKGSGTLDNPIILGAYGEGDKPILDGEGNVNGVVYLKNISNWIVQDLEITNYASERGTDYRSGILVENDRGGVISHIKILNNFVHDISSSFRYKGESHPHQYGGIAVNVIGPEPTDKYNNILIEGNLVERAGRTGIVVWDNHFASEAEASSNVVIKNNKVKDIDSDGILTFGCYGALIEHNVADACGSYREDNEFNGSAAIWSTRGRNCVIQYNEAMNTKALEGNNDGTGFDLDMDAIDCLVQYNYSHDNEGGFMLFVNASHSSGSIVRYNISQNDQTRVFMIAGGVTPNTQIYNNTIFVKEALDTKIIDHTWDEGGDINAPWMFKNNIVYNLGSGGYRLPGSGGTIEGNLFYGNHHVSEPDDAFKMTNDPQLENPGSAGVGIETLTGYQLKEASPLMNTGIFIPKNGGKDFWGNVVSMGGKPTRGAHEPSGDVSGEFQMIDKLNNWDFVFFKTDNWNLDSSNPHFFEGDDSRATRTDLGEGILIYNYPNIKSVEIKIHMSTWYPEISPAIVEVYASQTNDLGAFVEVPTTFESNPNIVEGWQVTTITTTTDIPEGYHFLGIRISNDLGESWATQIGEISFIYRDN